MVHLLTALLPTATVRLPQILLTAAQRDVAVTAIREAHPIININTHMEEALSLLTLEAVEARRSKKAFVESADLYRAQLRGNSITNPLRRIQIHQALMAAGYYARCVDLHVVGDPTEFVLNHYRFDIRRDTIVTQAVHQSVLEHMKTTPESDEALTNLILMERRLFGQNRLANVGGKQFIVLGVPTAEITDEAELKYVLDLAPIKQHGNFTLSYNTNLPGAEDRWKIATVTSGVETDYIPFDTTKVEASKLKFDLKILLPEKPKTFKERLKQTLLEYWVMWFAFWCMFWLVDEEILTLIGLIFAKYKQTQMLKEEAEKTGGKVYIGRAVRPFEKTDKFAQ